MGQALPLAVGLIAIPVLIRQLGAERFGILAIVWMVIGYFGVFDFGLGRAMTKIVADRLGGDRSSDVSRIVATTLLITLGFSVVGAIVVANIAPWLATDVLKIPTSLTFETIRCFYLLSVSIPVVVCSVCCRGVLEAYQRFDLVNAVRIPLGSFTFLAPLLVLPFSQSLVPIVVVLVLGRAVACGVYWLLSSKLYRHIHEGLTFDGTLTKQLFSFGGWMTVTNLAGPLMVYMDRFLIGSIISMAAVTYYATPYEVVSRLAFIPAAVASVLFPALSFSLAANRNDATKILQRGMDAIALLVLPLMILVTLFAEYGLRLWAGNDVALFGTRVLQWLALGVLFNSFAVMAVVQIQALGRPDLSAKLYLAELLPYGLTLWWLTHRYGIEGTAVALTIRAGVDLIANAAIVASVLPKARPALIKSAYAVAFSVVMLIGAMWASNHNLAMGYTLVAIAMVAANAWFNLLQRSDRLRIRSWVTRKAGA